MEGKYTGQEITIMPGGEWLVGQEGRDAAEAWRHQQAATAIVGTLDMGEHVVIVEPDSGVPGNTSGSTVEQA